MAPFLKLYGRKLVFALFVCAFVGNSPHPSHATGSSSGLDTGPQQSSMPFSIEGVTVMTLTASGLTMSQGNLNIQAGDLLLDTGRIGLGTITPESALDVSQGYIHIGQTVIQGGDCGPIQGLVATDSSGHLLSCVGSIWQSASKPKMTQTDQVTCVIGTNPGRGPCNTGGGSPGNISYTTPAPHDLCVLSQVAGWSGGLWGQCVIDGTPGARWNIHASNYSPNQTTCRMTCYDFQ